MDETGTDGNQTGLSAFSDAEAGEDGERDAAAEAAAVAGNGGDVFEIVDLDDIRYPDADEYVTFAVTQVDYTVEGRGDDEFPVVHLFGRTPEDHEPIHVEVYEFRPYFYAPTDSLTDADRQRDRITGWAEEDEDGEPFESIRDERLTKLFGQTPRDVGQMRDEYDHYEADILFPNRLLIDKDITSGVRVPVRREAPDEPIRVPHDEIEAVDASAEPRVNTFDIEVDDRHGFPEEGEETIVCLTSHDSYDDEYVVWLYDADAGTAPPESLAGYDPIEDDFDADVRVFEEEEAMLEAFVDYVVEDTDPDLLTGWNCLPADSEVLMADGTVREIQDVQVGDEVLGNEHQQTTTAAVTNKWKSEKEVLEFALADGTSLRSSGDHRIMVGDDERVDWKRGTDVEPGDYVLKPRKLNVDPSVPELSELVPAENQRDIDEVQVTEFKSALPHGAVAELAEEFGVTKETLYHPKTDVWTPKRCRTAADTYEVPLPDGGREYRRTGIELDREISETEVYLAGLVLTDGTMSTDDGIRFYNTREELHEQFPGDNVLHPDGKGCYNQNVLDWTRMHAFNGLGIPLGDKNEDAVDLSQVYELPEEYVARFLAGVIDGDGGVSSSVVVAAENRSIGEWYTKLFRRLGIYATQRENIVRVPDAARDLNRVQRDILPHMNHPEKVEAIEALEGGKSGQSETIPYSLFEADTGSDEKRIGRDKHRRGINLKRHETTNEEWDDYVFVPVEDVAVVGTETTYDIETTTHNFVADNCLVHNCDDFDVPYLLDRLEELQGPHHDYDLSIDRLSRVNEVWRNNWQGPNVKGRVVFDLLYAYQRTKFTELDSYRLDAVGEQELGVGKERYPGDIGDLWEDDPERLLEYNLRDVELCVELNDQQEIIPFWQEVASFVGCKLEDATTPGDAVDMYVLHKLHGNFALPSKGQHDAEDYEGGAVFDPITGVRQMVTVLDLKSLYPMCMVTINASPETKVDPDAYEGDTFRAPNGQHFRKEPDGVIREMVDELLTEREEKKSLRNDHDPDSREYEQFDRQQAAVKVIMNSLYGVLGWDRFRLYDKEMGAAVTATGREVIDYTDKVAGRMDKEVVYGDTDSVMIELGGDVSKEAAIEQSFELEEQINDAYDEFAAEELHVDLDAGEEHRFQIEFEKLYRRFFQAGKKKRYAGHIIWKEGKDVDDIDITGFEYQRSDIAPITKEVQKEVIDRIVTGADVEEIKDYVHGVIQDYEAGKVSLDDIAIPGGIGKKLDNYDTDTAQVRGAKYANLLLGTNFASGSKPKRLYLDRVHSDFWEQVEAERGLDPATDPLYGEFRRDPDVICFEYEDQVPEEFEVDWDKMLDKTLKGPIERILEALDISWDEVKSGQEQTGLGSFM